MVTHPHGPIISPVKVSHGSCVNKFVKCVVTVFSVTYLSVFHVCLDPSSLPWQPDVISRADNMGGHSQTSECIGITCRVYLKTEVLGTTLTQRAKFTQPWDAGILDQMPLAAGAICAHRISAVTLAPTRWMPVTLP